MNKTLLLISAQMLDLAGDEFANHGCNDLYLDGTSENIAFVEMLIASSDDTDRVPNIMPAGTKSLFGSKDLSGMILVNDVEIMFYCVKHLENCCK